MNFVTALGDRARYGRGPRFEEGAVRMLRAILPLLIGLSGLSSPALLRASAPTSPALPGAGTWTWPVVGPVIGAFEPPETPYGSGHRGIDIAAEVGTTVVAPEAGTVAFSGRVAGHLFVTLDHGGGLTSTYSWLSVALVRKGDVVARGAPIALSGQGHPTSSVRHLHFGVRRDGAYLDPLEFLGPTSVSDFIRLAPVVAA